MIVIDRVLNIIDKYSLKNKTKKTYTSKYEFHPRLYAITCSGYDMQ